MLWCPVEGGAIANNNDDDDDDDDDTAAGTNGAEPSRRGVRCALVGRQASGRCHQTTRGTHWSVGERHTRKTRPARAHAQQLTTDQHRPAQRGLVTDSAPSRTASGLEWRTVRRVHWSRTSATLTLRRRPPAVLLRALAQAWSCAPYFPGATHYTRVALCAASSCVAVAFFFFCGRLFVTRRKALLLQTCLLVVSSSVFIPAATDNPPNTQVATLARFCCRHHAQARRKI